MITETKGLALLNEKGYYEIIKSLHLMQSYIEDDLGILQIMNNRVRDLNAHRIYKEVETEAMQSCNYGKLLSKVQAVTKADPMFDKAYVLQGEIFLSLNRFNDALKVFDKALAANPYNAKAYASKSLIYDIKNFTEKALEYCNKALECVSLNESELLVSLFDQKLSILSRMKDDDAINLTLTNAQKLLPEEDFGYLSNFYAQESKLKLVAIS